jgi:uncharacterized membrane protein
MANAQEQRSGAENPKQLAVPVFPATSAEFITTVAHFHRAEIGRMAGWRDRVDRTSNWAITVVAAMLSLSLSSPTAHHGVLLFAMLLVLLLLWIEARRYRFFDVYRTRVRMLERHYFSQIFAPAPEPDNDWARMLGQDLRKPQFLITHREAMSRRLRRNYIWMFLILLLAWGLKIATPKLQQEGVHLELVRSFRDIFENAALGPVPGWAVMLAVAGFYGSLAFITLRTKADAGELAHGEVHV